MQVPSDGNNLFGPKKIDSILENEEIIVNAIYYQGRKITADVEVIIDLKNGLRYSCHTSLRLYSVEKKKEK